MKSLQTGQKVQIEFLSHTGSKIQLICTIADVCEESLILKYPKETEELIKMLKEGSQIKAFVFSSTNIKILDSVVLNAPCDSKIEIEFSDDYATIQRRAYIREDVVSRINLYGDNIALTTRTIDLGGGGTRFFSDIEIPQNTMAKVTIDINLDGKEIVNAIGCITHKDHFKPNEYLVEFTEITEDERSKILGKCIRRQVEKLSNK